MCLILFSIGVHSKYPLVFAGNRDEFYERPTAPASFWDESPHVLGGKDLKAGGTWLGVTRSGHWATVTNVRDQHPHQEEARSRGHLVAEYLRREPSPQDYLASVQAQDDRYNGFNLIVGTPDRVCYYSNRNGTPRTVEPGIHGMSNAQLDTSWPKVDRGKDQLQALADNEIGPGALLDILNDRKPAPKEALPNTGIGLQTERKLSPLFIEGERYGTRASTVILIHRSGNVTFVERTFDRGSPMGTNRFTFSLAG